MTRMPFALRASTALAAVAIATSAGAQSTHPPPDVAETPSTTSQESTEGGDIVVTGSRIRRDPLSQDAPIVFVDQEDMAKTGLSSVNDILQRLPSSGGGLNSKFNNSGNLGNPLSDAAGRRDRRADPPDHDDAVARFIAGSAVCATDFL